MTLKTTFACLTYHVIGEEQDQYTVSERQLRDHLSVLRKEAFVAEGFEELEGRLRYQAALPERYVVLTLDDGHESSLRAAEVLSDYGCRATFFLTRDRSEKKPGYIRPSEIRELRRRGFSLGTHGTTHRNLTFLPEQKCVEELADSKHWLEDILGEPIRYWAAPGGYVNSRVRALAETQGYVLTGTCNEWMNSPETCPLPGRVNRVNIRQHFSLQHLRRIVHGDMAFYLWRQARSAALAIPKQLFRDY